MREEGTASDEIGSPVCESASAAGLVASDAGAANSSRLAVTVICVLGCALFALRLFAPSNFLDQDQERPAAYVLDIIKNGSWLCQHDLHGDVMSKPPFYNWLAALLALPVGRVTLFALYLPGAAGVLGIALLLYWFGQRYFGTRPAFFGAVASMLTSAGLKGFGLARTDGVFAFTITLAALLAFRAWVLGRGWTWFWLMGAIATLTKGPLGLVLAGCGLLAWWWERRTGEPLALKGSHRLGIALFLLVAGGWFLMAYHQVGKPLTDKFFGQELANAALSEGSHRPGTLFYRPPLHYLARAAPWSILAYFGVWRVWRSPAAEVRERRFERFLCCWFVGGLVVLGLSPHQRADLLWPVMPAGALLAGREIDRVRERLATRNFRVAGYRWSAFNCVFGLLLALMVARYVFAYLGPQARTTIVRQTNALQLLAEKIAREPGAAFPLVHTDDPMALQIYLNTWRPPISFEHAAALLRRPEPVFVTISNPARLEPFRKPDDPPLYLLTPASFDGIPCPARVVGNRARFE